MKTIYPIIALLSALSSGLCHAELVNLRISEQALRKDAETAFARLGKESASSVRDRAAEIPAAPGTPAAAPSRPHSSGWKTGILTGIGIKHVAEIVGSFFSDDADIIDVATKDYVALEDYERNRVVGQDSPRNGGGPEFMVIASNGNPSELPMNRWRGEISGTVTAGELSTAVYALLCGGSHLLEIKSNKNGTYTIYKKESPYGRLSDCGRRCQ